MLQPDPENPHEGQQQALRTDSFQSLGDQIPATQTEYHEASPQSEEPTSHWNTLKNMLNSATFQIGGPLLGGVALLSTATFATELNHETRQELGIAGLSTLVGGAGLGFFSQWYQGNIEIYNNDTEYTNSPN